MYEGGGGRKGDMEGGKAGMNKRVGMDGRRKA